MFTLLPRRGSATYKRINAVELADTRRSKDKMVLEMSTTWADPGRQAVPILLLRRTSRGTLGVDGADVLFAFVHGFGGRASASLFGRGRPGEGLVSWDVAYGPTDSQGYLTVLLRNNDRGTVENTAYKWKGHGFTRVAEQSDYLGDSIAYHWNGDAFVAEDMSLDSHRNLNLPSSFR